MHSSPRLNGSTACLSSSRLSARLFPQADHYLSFTALPRIWIENRLLSALSLKLEPTLDEDVAYGMRLLVDIAERSVSESPFQDPTTAVQAIDRLHDILRQLARRPFFDGRVIDGDGEIRLLLKTVTWEDYVHLAFDEIRMAGAGSPQISRRLVAALVDLRRVALPERIDVLDEEAVLLRAATAESMQDERDVRFALRTGPRRPGSWRAFSRETRRVWVARLSRNEDADASRLLGNTLGNNARALQG